MDAQIARARKSRANKSKSFEKRFKTEIKMDEVKLRYTCECKILAKIIIDKRKDNVDIYMTHKCPKCDKGELKRLSIGGFFMRTNGICDHPGCKCEQVYSTFTSKEFNRYLNGESDEQKE
jgi:hypothetical protein